MSMIITYLSGINLETIVSADEVSYDKIFEINSMGEINSAAKIINNDTSNASRYLIKINSDIDNFTRVSFNANEIDILGNGHVLTGTKGSSVGFGVSGKTSVEYQSNVGGPAGGGLSVFAVRNIPVNIGNVSICNNIVSDGKDNGIGGGIAEGYYTNVVMDSTNIYENKAQKNGGGVAAIYNKEQKTTIISAQINNNDALSDSGGGIYYDSNSKIYLSGTISVQDNTAYCQSSDIKCTNNLNIISSSDNTTVYPIYIEGSIKGSKIGITDPKLWKEALDDSDNGTSSLEYLTSGYNANNPKYPDNNPSQYFTSDHAGVFCGRFRRGCQFSRILL